MWVGDSMMISVVFVCDVRMGIVVKNWEGKIVLWEGFLNWFFI